jgi:hypothetical protein
VLFDSLDAPREGRKPFVFNGEFEAVDGGNEHVDLPSLSDMDELARSRRFQDIENGSRDQSSERH